MTLIRPEIRRGSDAAFKILLRDQDGRPYDLTGTTYMRLKLPKENIGFVSVDSDLIPAVKATTTILVGSTSVVFLANTAGILGNDISLIFNGSDTLDDVITDWNAANPSNTVSTTASASLVPLAQTAYLSQAVDSYTKVFATSPLQLGEINIILTEADTVLLKIGRNMSMELTFDKGTTPAGQRKVVLLKESLNVEERFF